MVTEPDWFLFTDGGNFMDKSQQIAGYSVVTEQQVLKAKALLLKNQKNKLISLTRALALQRKGSIYSDSKYAFLIVHAHGTTRKERGLFIAKNKDINMLLKYWLNQSRWQSLTVSVIRRLALM